MSSADSSSQKFYVAQAIAYVNAPPHIGHAMEFIQGDALARFHRMKGDDVFFLTGTDEHGSKISQTAEKLGKDTQQVVDENAQFFKDLAQLLTIQYDDFVRTSTDNHKRGAQKLWQKLAETGDIYKGYYEGLYCVGCEAYVSPKDLIDGKCPNHNKEPEVVQEENYFFRLSKYSEQIGKLIANDELKIIPAARKNEVLQVIEDGLRDVSFSRPRSVLDWGVEVPDDPDHVMYVWCDALSNYITGLGYADEGENFQKYWPADVQLIGKDILRFHAAIWIGMLLSAGLPIPKAIYAHGFITSEGQKMSKTLGNVVDPKEYAETYGTDALRYYLLKEIPTTADGDFSKGRFITVYNSELANALGNLVSRVAAMTIKYVDGKVPEMPEDSKELFEKKVAEIWQNYEQAIDDFDLKRALETVFELVYDANKYVEDQKPWELAKQGADAVAPVLYNLLEMIRHIGILLQPFIPTTSTKMLETLGSGLPEDSTRESREDYEQMQIWGGLKPGSKVQKPDVLFARLEEEESA